MQKTTNLDLNKPEGSDAVNIDDLNENADIIDEKFAGGSAGHKHTGAAGDGAPIPIDGIEAAAKTTAGGNQANRLAVTGANGRVGDAERFGGLTLTQMDERVGTIAPVRSVAGKTGNVTLSGTDIPAATLSTRGTVQLNNSVSSTLTTQAATANAVKQAYDKAVVAESKADITRVNGGKLEYFDGAEWKEVGGVKTSVSSDSVQERFEVTRTTTSMAPMLVAKFTPKATGEIRITADLYKTASTGSGRLEVMSPKGITNSWVPLGTTLNWLTPLGAQYTQRSAIIDNSEVLMQITVGNTWERHSTDLVVTAQVPIYLFLTQGHTDYNVSCRNIEVKYNLV